MSEPVLFVGPLERVLHVKTLPAFARLGPGQLAAVAQHARESYFARGTRLMSPDRPADGFFVVVEGRVSVGRPGHAIREAAPGDEVGFVELLARPGGGLDARAETATLALEFDWAAHQDVCEEHFSVLFAHLRYLATSNVRALRRLPDSVVLSRAAPAAPPPPHPLNLVERMLTLRQASALSSGSVEALAELAEAATERRLPDGARVWSRGEPARSFLLLASGSVECRTRDGRRLHHEGSSLALGLYEALNDSPRWNDAVAHGDLVALEVPIDALLDTLESHFDLARDLLATMARRLLELRDRRHP